VPVVSRTYSLLLLTPLRASLLRCSLPERTNERRHAYILCLCSRCSPAIPTSASLRTKLRVKTLVHAIGNTST
jgi:hypothetical protein